MRCGESPRGRLDAEFSHGLYPELTHELYPDLYAMREQQKAAILCYLYGQGGSNLDTVSVAIGPAKSSMLRRLESLIFEGRIEEVQENGASIFRVARLQP